MNFRDCFSKGLLVAALFSGAAVADDGVQYSLVLPFSSYHYDRDLNANELNPGIGVLATIPERRGSLLLGAGAAYNSSKQLALFGLAGYIVPVIGDLSVGAGVRAVYVPVYEKFSMPAEIIVSYKISDRWAVNATANTGFAAFFATYNLK